MASKSRYHDPMLSFRGSPKPTLGLELEVQFVDPKTKDLTPKVVPILREVQKKDLKHFKSEYSQGMIEVITSVCKDIKEVRKDLDKKFALLEAVSDRHDAELAISGTHPFQKWYEQMAFPNDRYLRIIEKFQWVVRRVTIFGLHVHVGVRSGDRAIAVINRLIDFVPHFLALSSSSPFWGGRDTHMASCRAAVFSSFPTGGLPPHFKNWKTFSDYFSFLKKQEAVYSLRDIYWDIRPHFDFGTVELRVCDGLSTLSETMALAAFVQCLVVFLDEETSKKKSSEEEEKKRFWIAPENKWQAARYGLEGRIIDLKSGKRKWIKDDLRTWVEKLSPIAKKLNCHDELFFVERILQTGSSADRQRRVYEETGSLAQVVKALVKEFKNDTPVLK